MEMLTGACASVLQYAGRVFDECLGKKRCDLIEGNGPNPSLKHASPSSDRSLERTTSKLWVDTATTDRSTPTTPAITTTYHNYGTFNSAERHPTPISPGYLVPPSPGSEWDSDSTLSTDHSPGSNTNSFSNEAIAARPLADTSSPLEDAVRNARCECPEGSGHYFLPADAIQALLGIESIEEEIQCRDIPVPVGHSRRQLAQKILDHAPKLFCILVLLRKTQYISGFLEEHVYDCGLPFIRDGKHKSSKTFRLCSKLHPNRHIKCMSDGTPRLFQDFSREQWSVISPVFEKSDSIKHYKFDDNYILPFIRDEERYDAKVGGFGTVWEVEIHPAHHSFHSKILHPSFALKRLHSRDRELFDAEVARHKDFSKRRSHDHLVKLLATYEFKGQFYLLFPWAKGTLRDYWEQTPNPEFTSFTVKWFLRQCKGIASALQRIHGYQTTFEAKKDLENIHSASHNTDPNLTDPTGRKYGIHGDIKADNILWSDEDTPDDDPHFNEEGILLIADFGLMTSHANLTHRRTPEQMRGSAPYEPPEATESRKTAISRAYDIWSLGCVYLEFVTWLLCNFEQVEHFRRLRSSGDDDRRFFTLPDNGQPNLPRRAIVKASVRNWMKELHKKPKCSEFVHEFLDLIAERMLVVDLKERIHCGPLNEKLTEMVRRAEENSSYLILGDPSPIHRRVTALSDRDNQSSLNPKDGSPLPKRPSVIKLQALGRCHTGALSSETEWHTLSPPSSPTGVEVPS